MGGLLWRVRRVVVSEPTSGIHAECRRCGRSVSEQRQRCPDCGAADVARYEL